MYCGQPGTLYLGGALPPPQSRKSHLSPVPGTYQATEAPAGEDTSVVVQPVKSVLAEARTARSPKMGKGKVVMEGIGLDNV